MSSFSGLYKKPQGTEVAWMVLASSFGFLNDLVLSIL
jgi:hypothetical protein